MRMFGMLDEIYTRFPGMNNFRRAETAVELISLDKVELRWLLSESSSLCKELKSRNLRLGVLQDINIEVVADNVSESHFVGTYG